MSGTTSGRLRTLWISASLLSMAYATRLASPTEQIQAPAPPGERVDIGGQHLHLYCTGRGSPTVLLEAGTGDFSVIWSLVQPGVSRFARVCSYDRGGYAWSEPGKQPRTFAQLALELHSGMSISPDSLERERRFFQADLAGLSHRGRLIFATHSGHNIHLEEPELVIEAIRQVVVEARRP